MALVEVTLTKGAAQDSVEVRRGGGAPMRFTFPKKGPIPHDYVHFVVEDAFGFSRGFWGMIADGAAPAEIQEIAKAGGHASAARAQIPAPEIVELIQAERLVECFEADLWGAPADGDTFRGVAAAACAHSLVPCPVLADERIVATRKRIADFARAWMAAPLGAQFSFQWSARLDAESG
ncbi:MAG: hypothetical protein AB7Q23_14520 [Hyphomonadaceae bacterium]